MSGALLGVALDVEANLANPIAAVPSAPVWLAFGTAIVSHLQSSATFGPLGLVCPSAGGQITGTCAIGGMNAATLGSAIATAWVGVNPLPAIAYAKLLPGATALATAFIAHVTANATIGITGLLAPTGSPTSGGPLTGAGTISGMNASALGTAFATALGTQTNPTSLSNWQSIAGDIITHMTTLGTAIPGTLAATSGGGPIIIGAGALS
jgi:hypothetical protein